MMITRRLLNQNMVMRLQTQKVTRSTPSSPCLCFLSLIDVSVPVIIQSNGIIPTQFPHALIITPINTAIVGTTGNHFQGSKHIVGDTPIMYVKSPL